MVIHGYLFIDFVFSLGNDPQVFIYNLYYYMVYDIFCLGVKLFEVRPFLGPHKV